MQISIHWQTVVRQTDVWQTVARLTNLSSFLVILTLIKMALLAPWCRMALKKECPCSASSPADPKLRTLTKYQSLNSLLTENKCFIQLLLFGFTFLDLLIKFMKMRLLYILYCPPTSATWRQGHFYTFAILYRPICRSPPPSHPAFLLAGAPAHHAVTFLAAGGRGGDWYYITTCRIAEGSKDPCN